MKDSSNEIPRRRLLSFTAILLCLSSGVVAPMRRSAGSDDSAPLTIGAATVTRSSHDKLVEYPWGHLRWFASADLKNSSAMTVGLATFKPGTGIPLHAHPNGDEIVHVVKGHVLVTVGNESIQLNEGDTITFLKGVRHSGKNLDTEDAVMFVSFSSPDRRIVWE